MASNDDLMAHMRHVQAADRDMRDLSLVWQMIEASSAISCPDEVQSILPTLSQTRARFDDLQRRLVRQLGAGSVAELGDELAAQAQCTIDILVRNLFERTADVGFLAADEAIRAFCADAAPAPAAVEALRGRLAEYVAKYSVYDDVIVLDPQGTVLARLDRAATLNASRDPLVSTAVQQAGFVERFAVSDLGRDARPCLLYAHRIEGSAGPVSGVLVLRFRLADELAAIFAGVASPRLQTAIVLLDGDDLVVASNDEAHVPLGAQLKTVTGGGVGVIAFAGREYLGITCETRGYQGHRGPGWRAQAMVSLLTAFRPRAADTAAVQATLDNPELRAIQHEADSINANLRRVVWNGRLMASSHQGDRVRLKAVLTQVNRAGVRTRERVAQAIHDLYRTSLDRTRQQAVELARLAADILDRNLYERANDCRWWALAPALRAALAAPATPAADAALGGLLAHINGLYTVYGRLVAFDEHGVIRAATHDEQRVRVGTAVAADLLAAARGLADGQRYAVTPFASSPLADGQATWIYVAAVRSPQDRRFVGGIAIVFNAAQELAAMLSDVLGKRDGVAAFVDAQGTVVAASDPALAVGSVLPVRGVGIVEHDGRYLACAEAGSTGYREFGRSGGYQHGVRTVVALRLGRVEQREAALAELEVAAAASAERGPLLEVAVCHVGAGRYALPADRVLEARPRRGLVRTPGATGIGLGLLEVAQDGVPRLVQVLCGRRLLGVSYPARESDGVIVIINLAPGSRTPLVGLWVDDVAAVTEIDPARVQPVPAAMQPGDALVTGVVDLGQPDAAAMVQLLDCAQLCAHVRRPDTATAVTAAKAAGRAVAEVAVAADGRAGVPAQPTAGAAASAAVLAHAGTAG
jgi:chemotaxis signal transduction protein